MSPDTVAGRYIGVARFRKYALTLAPSVNAESEWIK
jgi:hypothetical protein